MISEGNVLEITFYSDATVAHTGRYEHKVEWCMSNNLSFGNINICL